MGGACIVPCTLESGCAIASSAVAISAKSYDIYKTRKRSKSLPSVCNKVLLPPIKRKRNYTE